MSSKYGPENDAFAACVLAGAPEQGSFPFVAYDADGDCIEFIARDDSFYAERVDPLVTVYYSQETKEVVGSLIKGVGKFLSKVKKRAPGFIVEVHDGRIRLEHLFTARLWAGDYGPNEKFIKLTYQKLREVADETDAEVELGELACA